MLSLCQHIYKILIKVSEKISVRIYLASWDNPFEWDEPSTAVSQQIMCTVPTRHYPLMVREFGVDKAIIVALDSVVTARGRNKVDFECARTNPRLKPDEDSSIVMPREVENYGGWVKAAFEYINCVAVNSIE